MLLHCNVPTPCVLPLVSRASCVQVNALTLASLCVSTAMQAKGLCQELSVLLLSRLVRIVVRNGIGSIVVGNGIGSISLGMESAALWSGMG